MKAAMGLAFAADVPLMASTFCNRYGQRRLRMGSEPPAEEWEQTFGARICCRILCQPGSPAQHASH